MSLLGTITRIQTEAREDPSNYLKEDPSIMDSTQPYQLLCQVFKAEFITDALACMTESHLRILDYNFEFLGHIEVISNCV